MACSTSFKDPLVCDHVHDTIFLLSTSFSNFLATSLPFICIDTGELEVAVHLAYAFAQKNKIKGVTTTDTKKPGSWPCVLLCAPSDTAVDSALCELYSVLSAQCSVLSVILSNSN